MATRLPLLQVTHQTPTKATLVRDTITVMEQLPYTSTEDSSSDEEMIFSTHGTSLEDAFEDEEMPEYDDMDEKYEE